MRLPVNFSLGNPATRVLVALAFVAAIPVVAMARAAHLSTVPLAVGPNTSGTALKPPVIINGASKNALLNITNSNKATGSSIYAQNASAYSTINGTNSGGGSAGYFANTGSGTGLYVQAATLDAIDATSSGDNGITGTTSASGRVGVLGMASGLASTALQGQSTQGLGLLVQSSGDPYNSVALVTDLNNNILLLLDTSGNLYIHGKLEQKDNFGNSERSTFERAGSATALRGAASIGFDRNTVSELAGRNYAVFLTPLGDSRGLYVAQKTISGFTIRESGGGHSTLGFDYRIVALQ